MKNHRLFALGWFSCLFAAIAILAHAGELYQGREAITVDSDTLSAVSTSSGKFRIGRCVDFHALKGYIILGAASTTDSGVGTQDTCIIALRSTLGQRSYTIDTVRGAIPCTLNIAKALNDTLLAEDLEINYSTTDSISVDGLSWEHKLFWYIVGR